MDKSFFHGKQADNLDDKPKDGEKSSGKTAQKGKTISQDGVQTELEELKQNGKPTLFDETKEREVEPVIDIGHVIKIKFLDDGKERTIKLAKNRNGIKETDGFVVIDEKSPMGKAVLGKKVGDTFEIGNLEKYCKVLAIN